MTQLNKPTLERLLLYYHFVSEHLVTDTGSKVSSSQIAKLLSLDDTQVRKDLAAVGVRGRPHVGFDKAEVVSRIRQALGFDNQYSAIVIGAGRLGGAISSYPNFKKCGLNIAAIFDSDPTKAGVVIGGNAVQPLEQLEEVIAARKIKLAILTIPSESAQAMANRLIKAGIRAFWSFAPTHIIVPEGIIIRHEHLAVGLAELSYRLNRLNLPE